MGDNEKHPLPKQIFELILLLNSESRKFEAWITVFEGAKQNSRQDHSINSSRETTNVTMVRNVSPFQFLHKAKMLKGEN